MVILWIALGVAAFVAIMVGIWWAYEPSDGLGTAPPFPVPRPRPLPRPQDRQP